MSARAIYKFRTAAPLNRAFHWPSEGAAGVSDALFPSRLQAGHGTVILSVSKAATSDVLNSRPGHRSWRRSVCGAVDNTG